MDELVYTWDEFFADAKKLAEQIKPEKPESLLVITKGGMFLGGMLSEYLDIPIVETISIRSYVEHERKQLEVLKGAKTDLPNPLIVDDIVDSGQTLSFLTNNYKARSVALFYKPKTSVIKPDFYLHETDKWVKFPWEVKLKN